MTRRNLCLKALSRATLLLVVAVGICSGVLSKAQDVSVARLPQSTDMTVRLENLISHNSYEASSGDYYFIVPTGRYSLQLLRGGQVMYQEMEYLSVNSPGTRTVNPEQMEIVVGLSSPAPHFDPTACVALTAAARLAVSSYGLHDADVQRRLANAEPGGDGSRCSSVDNVEAMVRTRSGSYGVTALGMLKLSIDFTSLGGVRRPRNRGNSPIYNDPSTQRLSPIQQSSTDLTPGLVADLKNGIADVGVDEMGKPLLVCAAINANTPLFCDSNGLAVGTPAIAHLRGLYRFSIKTVPVDSRGVEDDHWTTFAGEDEYHATKGKLIADLQAVEANLSQGIAKLQAASVAASGGGASQAGQPAYPADGLAALIASTQASIDAALKTPTLQPLRSHFPQVLVQMKASSRQTVPEAEALRSLQQLTEIVTVLAKAVDDLGVDLVFRTSPVETEDSHLSFETCNRCFTIASQGGEHRFYRGRYYVKASRDGYMPFEGWLDLVAEPQTIFECDMVRVSRAVNGRASSCSVRAQ